MQHDDFMFVIEELQKMYGTQHMLLYDLHFAASQERGTVFRRDLWAKLNRLQVLLNEKRAKKQEPELQLMTKEGALTPMFHQFFRSCIIQVPSPNGKGCDYQLVIPSALRHLNPAPKAS